MTIKVLHVVPLSESGEAPIFVDRQIRSLRDAGVAGEVLGFRGAATWSRPWLLLKKIREVRERVERSKPDIVHAHWGSLLSAITVLASGDRPVVITYRGSDVNFVPTDKVIVNVVRRWLSRYSARNAAVTIFVSDELRRQIPARTNAGVVIPDGTDLSIFKRLDRLSCRTRLGINDSDVAVAFYEGGRPKQKGRLLVESALEHLRNRSVKCKLLTIGTGRIPAEVADMLAAANCTVLASATEGSPNIVRESIACGTPVVSVDVGDARKWIEGMSFGVIVDRSPESIAGGISDVLARKDWAWTEGMAEAFGLAYTTSLLIYQYKRVGAQCRL